MSSDSVATTLKFGPFELSTRQRVLRRDGVALPLGSRALDILIYLAERPGEVIGKKQLIDHVWSDVIVEEGSLRVHVAAIRKALADGQFGNRYVANVQGRGYSFVGQVARLEDDAIDKRDRAQNEVGLPAQLIRMIGREVVLDDVKDRIRNGRFVTLLGPGGIGKTTVAVAVGRAMAEAFNGGVHFVDLGSLTDPHHVAAAVGTSLGLALKANDATAELLDAVRSKKLLIILDSCEHLIDAVASLAERLLQEATQVYILATSRELLKVEGEYCHRVLPLDFPPDSLQATNAMLRYPAIQLFVERVAAKGGDFVLTDAEAPYVAEICRKLDGIPLAIELVAGRVAALGIKNTVTSLVSRLELLKLSRRTSVPRHRTLRATLDWSYDLLSDIEKIVFRRIAPFVGHFTLEGAHYVAGELGSRDGGIFDAIAGLVEKSLLTTRTDETQVLYRLPDTERAYALEKLELHTEKDTVLLRHAQYVTEHLESQREILATQARTERVAFYSSQLGDVRAALEWSFGPHGDEEIATRLVAACTQLLLNLSLMIECQVWAERAIARLGDRHESSRREMEIHASLPLALMHMEGSNERVREGFCRALDIAAEQHDLAYELRLLRGLFMYSRWTTDMNGALLLQNDRGGGILLLKRALQELEDQRHEMLNIDFVCDLSAGLVAPGKHEETLTLIVNALEVQQRGGKYLYVPALLRMKGLALVARSAEDYAEAESSLLSSIDWARRQSASLYKPKSSSDLAELLLLQGGHAGGLSSHQYGFEWDGRLKR
jgi:predicted ATPase/DNA-binding winged helix-turn-helix (wHTH) protein